MVLMMPLLIVKGKRQCGKALGLKAWVARDTLFGSYTYSMSPVTVSVRETAKAEQRIGGILIYECIFFFFFWLEPKASSS